jgi:glycosyltransferase involved in cell wall biosynthesis
MKLSVVLAVYNEEKNIQDCLESVKDFADEIIIVDGGSTDNTVEIAQKYTAKIIKTDNPPIFHINKQIGVNAAKGEWILQLDADERITGELRKEIINTINSKDSYAGYFIPRKNYFLGKWMEKGGLYPDNVIRLFKNGKGKFPCKNVHEQIEIDGLVASLINPMEHIAFPNFNTYLRKFETYTNLRKEEIKNKFKKPTPSLSCKFFFCNPLKIFFSRYVRHRGYKDGTPGFVFAVVSAYHEIIAYGKFITEGQKTK